MTEVRATMTMVGAAVALVITAWTTMPRPIVPGVFADVGASFFPEFSDASLASSLEAVEFDEQTATARPFKVQVQNGLWTIPSHFNYPADGHDRLAKTAAAIMALRKDSVASEQIIDQERTGTLDPLDETLPNLQGRGSRVIIRGAQERVLADVIIGKPLEHRAGYRYVRLPQQQRIYVAETRDLDISTQFADWIEPDLLQLEWDDVDQVIIRDYSFNEATRGVAVRDTLYIQKAGTDGWSLRGGTAGEGIDTFKMNLLVTTLDQLSIIGVRPKPAGLSEGLVTASGSLGVSKNDVRDLASKGFYFTPAGQLLSNEGDVLVHTRDGVFYSLRFGEITDEEADAPASVGLKPAGAAAARSSAGAGPNRYLFVSVAVDRTAAPEGVAAAAVAKRAAILRARFAPWYYIISGESFERIRLQRKDLVKTRTP